MYYRLIFTTKTSKFMARPWAASKMISRRDAENAERKRELKARRKKLVLLFRI